MFINNIIREDAQNGETNDELYYYLLNYIFIAILYEVIDLSCNGLLLNANFLTK